ncbi:hypothetical protein ES695_08905 [Candidatus Atribacteria bacterium 1244-E10-H5-B2]|nr:MAG: hypothetical protein ES695_08905 [Candidatus Atribacteria bacterium 1244-E10-H5-B2]
MERPKISRAQIIYGEIIYWFSIIATIICTIGSVIVISFPNNNVMNPHYLFSAIWRGEDAEAVWQVVGGGFPGGHFWLHNLTTGDGFTQLGLVIGCACAFLALVGAAIAYIQEKPKAYGWALLSLWVASLVILSMLGMYQV